LLEVGLYDNDILSQADIDAVAVMVGAPLLYRLTSLTNRWVEPDWDTAPTQHALVKPITGGVRPGQAYLGNAFFDLKGRCRRK